jgi:transcriptional regulator with XRE-family HTH domain
MHIKADTIAEFIRVIRKEKGLSQKELALKLGMRNQFISNIERRQVQFPLKRINLLASVLDIPAESIVNLLVEDFRKSAIKEITK